MAYLPGADQTVRTSSRTPQYKASFCCRAATHLVGSKRGRQEVWFAAHRRLAKRERRGSFSLRRAFARRPGQAGPARHRLDDCRWRERSRRQTYEERMGFVASGSMQAERCSFLLQTVGRSSQEEG